MLSELIYQYLQQYSIHLYDTPKEISMHISILYWCAVAIVFILKWSKATSVSDHSKFLITALLVIILPIILWCIL